MTGFAKQQIKQSAELGTLKLLPLMQKSGRLIADDATTTVSFAKHIQEIISLGYDGDIHSNFSKFICQNYYLATEDKVK